MRGIICSNPGCFDKIKIVELPVPEPKENQIQISVKASSLSVSDFKPFIDRMETGKLSMASKFVAGKQPFGGDVAGIVTKVGKNVSGMRTFFRPLCLYSFYNLEDLVLRVLI